MDFKEETLSKIRKLKIENKKTWRKVAGKMLLITAPLILVSGLAVFEKTLGNGSIPFIREEVTTYKHTTTLLNQDEQIITFEGYLPSKDVDDSVLIQKEPIEFEASQFKQNVITYTISDVDIELLKEAIANNDISLIVKYIEQKKSQTEEVVIPYDINDVINSGELSAVINLIDINDSKVVLESVRDNLGTTTGYTLTLIVLILFNLTYANTKTGNEFYNVKRDLEDIWLTNEKIKELKLK